MIGFLARNWWALAIRGVLALIFGVIALVWPGITLAALVLVFGSYALIDGLFSVITGARRAAEQRSGGGALILEGLLGFAAGLVAFLWPAITTLALLYLIAAWAILTGILEIAAAVRLRREISNEAWLALVGLVSLAFGIMLLIWPAAGILAVVWMIGVYGILFGLTMLVTAFRLRARRAGSDAA